MDRRPSTQQSPGSPGNPIPLPSNKKLLQSYYAGKRLPSPMGGQLDVLGVREGERGAGRVLLECNVSSLRFALAIPRATRTERAKVKEAMDSGDELTCPRHGGYQRLAKSGKNWICPLCGVSYGKSG
jgi:hypothetical protein